MASINKLTILGFPPNEAKHLGDDSAYTCEISSYTPSLAQVGTMTFAGTTINKAKYSRLGKLVHLLLDIEGTTGGAGATPFISATLPIPAVASQSYTLPGLVIDGGGLLGGFSSAGSTTRLDIYRHDGANWGLGAGRRFIIDGWYEAAEAVS